ncbi:DNA-binding protein [Sphingobacterium sp. UGAL515B_05]|uniref:DNA-binding protein n=1 Tax=Sphingobacterium sp. UGAL515B_05 TaxID=2986767 RepID=UPI002955C9E8|nr:DNA-binding protein [Sphingobacterium sp. UGAL515B_05]WON93752.1 helix-turn-helix domain-containing protein [Sphingobacterium sp. UGAL515B_05]
MQINIVTKDDLEDFRIKLLSDIKEILKIQEVKSFPRSIKTKQVLEILEISAGKLQQMRIAGELTYKKVGGTYYYNYNEVKRLLPKELNGGYE